MKTRATHEVQSDAMKLVNVRLLSAIESCDWIAVHECGYQLCEIANRGLYHAAMERKGDVAKLAMQNYQSEPESR
jgi:hypothetical protein